MKPPGDPAGGLSRALRLPRVGPLALSFGLTFAPLTACADSMALWRIVHDACVPHAETGEGPKPCESVDLAHGEAEGVAILKDLNGVAQMLAIPTRRITGIEDPQMLTPDAPHVFADAWRARALLEARLGRPLPREAVGSALDDRWRAMTLALKGRVYFARRLESADHLDAEPLKALSPEAVSLVVREGVAGAGFEPRS